MSMNSHPVLFLIDGMALAYRVYYAFERNPLVNSRGENVSTVFGFTNTLLQLIDGEKPDFFAVVFDTPEPTFRHELYEEYKATRKEMPDDMVEQLPRIREMLSVLQIPIIAKPGFEADDIIGTLAQQASQTGVRTVIVSGDKDMMQLVNSKTVILNPKRGGQGVEWVDERGVQEKIGLPPGKIIDYLALMGDSSDNIPGVAGIGPVTALKLLQQFGTLDQVLSRIEEITDKRARTSLEKSAEAARLSKQLATIHCNVPLETSYRELQIGQINRQTAFEFFQRMEFRTLAERYAPINRNVAREYHLLHSEAELEELIRLLVRTGRFVFDTETTSIDPMKAELVGLSFCCSSGTAYYVPVDGPHDLTSENKPLSLRRALALLKPLFEDESIKKCGQNAKYDILVLSHYDIVVKGLVFDTMLASYLLDPSARQHNLDALALAHFNLKKIPTSQLIGSGANQITMNQVPIENVSEYACEDADVTWRLWEKLEPLVEELELTSLMQQVEIPLMFTLITMEKHGVHIDRSFLGKLSHRLEGELNEIEHQIYESAGVRFNINSPKQLGQILFEKLNLPSSRKTKTGFSTDVTVLEELASQHELPRKILDYRQYAKLKSTYVDALPRMVNSRTGRLHTSYNQTVAATGRLSSSDPNLQNIPIRTELGSSIRAAFIPTDADHVLVDADYSQIELRIMAHLSGDRTLLTSFLNDEDVHQRTAALVFNVPPAEVTPEQRRKAKEVNFGIMYGMGAYGLSQRLNISMDEAVQFIEAYFVSYPLVQRFMVDVVREAREKGYVTTLLKRRRYIPEINSDNRRIREFAERTAINTPIQGSAADMIKVAMIHIQRRLEAERLHTKMILQVHDELVFDVPKTELDTVKLLIRQEMEHAITLQVPIKVEIGVGSNWLEAH
ncbi:MAG: DNA polymerase I [Calditrichaeota bacterium]|nr:MAG: DNA polymerase I [Calditrichota bacterium]